MDCSWEPSAFGFGASSEPEEQAEARTRRDRKKGSERSIERIFLENLPRLVGRGAAVIHNILL
jgi:hypothetical protein